MKKLITQLMSLTLLALVSVGTLAAQSQQARSNYRAPKHQTNLQAMPFVKKTYSGNEQLVAPANDNSATVPTSKNTARERGGPAGVQIATTYYDLQTNNTGSNRVLNKNGKITASWTTSQQVTAWSDRGTGYNTSADGGMTWGAQPSTRLETVRTGWPALTEDKQGTQYIVSHKTGTPITPYLLKKAAGATTWTESGIPTPRDFDILWYRTAQGGADGKTLHVIGSTPNTVITDGVASQVFYWRSTDGGTTWDKQAVTFPQLDSTSFKELSSDSYAMDARDSVVVIAFFSSWNDSFILKSTNNGNTWTKTIFFDFPLDLYVTDTPYGIGDIPVDTTAPAPAAIATTDGSGAMIIDNNNKVHIAYGKMYVADEMFGDGSSSYYPGINGIQYWNESFGTNPAETISGALDINGNDSLDIANGTIATTYFGGLASQPSFGIDAANRLYLGYSAAMETNQFLYTSNDGSKHYRHVYLMKSNNGGVSWGAPKDLITSQLVIEADVWESMEASYPSLARNVDSKVHLIYQQDYIPGIGVIKLTDGSNPDQAECGENAIVYIGVDVASVPTGNNEIFVSDKELAFSIVPNPSNGMIEVACNVEKAGDLTLSFFNLTGQEVRQIKQGRQDVGIAKVSCDLSDLPIGIYFAKINIGDKVAVKKIVVQ